MESWIEKVGRVIKRWCRIKLDESSWLEEGGREQDWYCESSRKFLFDCEVIDRHFVEVRFPRDLMWQCETGKQLVTDAELALIAPKLQKYYEKEWGKCTVSTKRY